MAYVYEWLKDMFREHRDVLRPGAEKISYGGDEGRTHVRIESESPDEEPVIAPRRTSSGGRARNRPRG